MFLDTYVAEEVGRWSADVGSLGGGLSVALSDGRSGTVGGRVTAGGVVLGSVDTPGWGERTPGACAGPVVRFWGVIP
jgi:hypothetical protein